MVNAALREVQAKGAHMAVVQLDGHVLNDDRAALYELARQLSVGDELEKRDFVRLGRPDWTKRCAAALIQCVLT